MNKSLFPRILSVLLCFSLIWTSGGVLDAASAVPEIFAGASHLPQIEFAPPGQFGRIVDYFNASKTAETRNDGDTKLRRHETAGNSQQLVILIQDLHAHYGVQKNIAGLLEFLSGKLSDPSRRSETPTSRDSAVPTTPPFALAVEGASGPIDSSVMALFPDEKIKLAASDYLMREGELTGAEYFAIKRGIPHLLVGVENEKYYTAHRDLFRQTLQDRQEWVGTLKGLQHDINELPRYVFHKNKALWEFHQQCEAYEKAEMSTHDFIGYLTSSPAATGGGSINLKRDFPTLASFAANSHYGTMDQVRAATSQFLTQIQPQLSPEEKTDLKVLAKNQSTSAYYLYLRELVYKKQLFLAVPPELGQYMEFIHTAQTMGMDRVTHETKGLAFKIKLALAGQLDSTQARDLVQVQHDLDLLLRLADLQATEFEVRDFAPRLNQFVALTKALLKDKTQFDEQNVRKLISSSIDFYVMALMRNKPMIENTLALHAPISVLVAGGFHTLQMTNLLREKNVSYIVINPTVESLTEADHALYVKRLNGNLLTLDEIRSAAQQAKAPKSVQDRLANLLSLKKDQGLSVGFPRPRWVHALIFAFILAGVSGTLRAQVETTFKDNQPAIESIHEAETLLAQNRPPFAQTPTPRASSSALNEIRAYFRDLAASMKRENVGYQELAKDIEDAASHFELSETPGYFFSSIVARNLTTGAFNSGEAGLRTYVHSDFLALARAIKGRPEEKELIIALFSGFDQKIRNAQDHPDYGVVEQLLRKKIEAEQARLSELERKTGNTQLISQNLRDDEDLGRFVQHYLAHLSRVDTYDVAHMSSIIDRTIDWQKLKVVLQRVDNEGVKVLAAQLDRFTAIPPDYVQFLVPNDQQVLQQTVNKIATAHTLTIFDATLPSGWLFHIWQMAYQLELNEGRQGRNGDSSHSYDCLSTIPDSHLTPAWIKAHPHLTEAQAHRFTILRAGNSLNDSEVAELAQWIQRMNAVLSADQQILSVEITAPSVQTSFKDGALSLNEQLARSAISEKDSLGAFSNSIISIIKRSSAGTARLGQAPLPAHWKNILPIIMIAAVGLRLLWTFSFAPHDALGAIGMAALMPATSFQRTSPLNAAMKELSPDTSKRIGPVMSWILHGLFLIAMYFAIPFFRESPVAGSLSNSQRNGAMSLYLGKMPHQNTMPNTRNKHSVLTPASTPVVPENTAAPAIQDEEGAPAAAPSSETPAMEHLMSIHAAEAQPLSESETDELFQWINRINNILPANQRIYTVDIEAAPGEISFKNNILSIDTLAVRLAMREKDALGDFSERVKNVIRHSSAAEDKQPEKSPILKIMPIVAAVVGVGAALAFAHGLGVAAGSPVMAFALFGIPLEWLTEGAQQFIRRVFRLKEAAKIRDTLSDIRKPMNNMIGDIQNQDRPWTSDDAAQRKTYLNTLKDLESRLKNLQPASSTMGKILPLLAVAALGLGLLGALAFAHVPIMLTLLHPVAAAGTLKLAGIGLASVFLNPTEILPSGNPEIDGALMQALQSARQSAKAISILSSDLAARNPNKLTAANVLDTLKAERVKIFTAYKTLVRLKARRDVLKIVKDKLAQSAVDIDMIGHQSSTIKGLGGLSEDIRSLETYRQWRRRQTAGVAVAILATVGLGAWALMHGSDVAAGSSVMAFALFGIPFDWLPEGTQLFIRRIFGTSEKEMGASLGPSPDTLAELHFPKNIGNYQVDDVLGPAVLDQGVTEDQEQYLVMSHLGGTRLDTLHPSLEQAVTWMDRIAEGVGILHQEGWGHRDLKPSNILVDEKDPRHPIHILDLGLAMPLGDEDDSASGVPLYLPPERRRTSPSQVTIEDPNDRYHSVEEFRQALAQPPAGGAEESLSRNKSGSVSIEIPTTLRRIAESQDFVTVNARTPLEAVQALAARYPAMQLVNDKNELRPYVQLFLNDEKLEGDTSRTRQLQANDVLRIEPIIAGGKNDKEKPDPVWTSLGTGDVASIRTSDLATRGIQVDGFVWRFAVEAGEVFLQNPQGKSVPLEETEFPFLIYCNPDRTFFTIVPVGWEGDAENLLADHPENDLRKLSSAWIRAHIDRTHNRLEIMSTGTDVLIGDHLPRLSQKTPASSKPLPIAWESFLEPPGDHREIKVSVIDEWTLEVAGRQFGFRTTSNGRVLIIMPDNKSVLLKDKASYAFYVDDSENPKLAFLTKVNGQSEILYTSHRHFKPQDFMINTSLRVSDGHLWIMAGAKPYRTRLGKIAASDRNRDPEAINRAFESAMNALVTDWVKKPVSLNDAIFETLLNSALPLTIPELSSIMNQLPPDAPLSVAEIQRLAHLFKVLLKILPEYAKTTDRAPFLFVLEKASFKPDEATIVLDAFDAALGRQPPTQESPALTLPDTYVAGAIKYLLSRSALDFWTHGDPGQKALIEKNLKDALHFSGNVRSAAFEDALAAYKVSPTRRMQQAPDKPDNLKRWIEIEYSPTAEVGASLLPGFLNTHRNPTKAHLEGLRAIWLATYGSGFSMAGLFTWLGWIVRSQSWGDIGVFTIVILIGLAATLATAYSANIGAHRHHNIRHLDAALTATSDDFLTARDFVAAHRIVTALSEADTSEKLTEALNTGIARIASVGEYPEMLIPLLDALDAWLTTDHPADAQAAARFLRQEALYAAVDAAVGERRLIKVHREVLIGDESIPVIIQEPSIGKPLYVRIGAVRILDENILPSAIAKRIAHEQVVLTHGPLDDVPSLIANTHPQAAAPAISPQKSRLQRVFVVDDHESIQTALIKSLESEGVTAEFITADSAKAAFEIFRTALEEGKPFDLVITDQEMESSRNGEVLAHRIRQSGSTVPIYLFTGENPNKTRGTNPDITKVFEKQTDSMKLVDAVVKLFLPAPSRGPSLGHAVAFVAALLAAHSFIQAAPQNPSPIPSPAFENGDAGARAPQAPIVRVQIPSSLRQYTGQQETVAISGHKTVRDVLESLIDKYPGLGSKLKKNDSWINGLRLYLNNTDHAASLKTALTDNDVLIIIFSDQSRTTTHFSVALLTLAIILPGEISETLLGLTMLGVAALALLRIVPYLYHKIREHREFIPLNLGRIASGAAAELSVRGGHTLYVPSDSVKDIAVREPAFNQNLGFLSQA